MSATIYTHVIILVLSTCLSGLTLRHLNTGDAQEFVQSSFAALYEVDSGLRDEGTLIDIDLLVPLLREDCGEGRYPRQTGYSFPAQWSRPDFGDDYGVNYSRGRQRYGQRPLTGYYQQNKGPVYQNAGRAGKVYNPMLYHPPSHGQYMPGSKPNPNGNRPGLYGHNYPNAGKVPNSPYVPPARRPGWNLAPGSRPDGHPNSRLDSRPDMRSGIRPEIRPDIRPEYRPTNRPSSRPDIRPNSRPNIRPDNRPNSRPDSGPTSCPANRPFCQPVIYNNPDARRLPNTRYLQVAGHPSADLRSNRPPMYPSPAAGRNSNTRYLQMARYPTVNMVPVRPLVTHRPAYPMKIPKLPKYNGLDRSRVLKPGEWNLGYDRGRHFANFAKLSKVKQQTPGSEQLSEDEREEAVLQNLLQENGYEGELVSREQTDQLIPDAINQLEEQKEDQEKEEEQKDDDQKETDEKETDQTETVQKEADQKEADQKGEGNERVNNELVENHSSNQENSDNKKENEGENQAEEADHKEEDSQPKVTKEEGQKMEEEQSEKVSGVNEVNEGPKVANKQMMTAEREHPDKNMSPLRDGKDGPLGLSKNLAHTSIPEGKICAETKTTEETTLKVKDEEPQNKEDEEADKLHTTFTEAETERRKEDRMELAMKQDNTDRNFQEEKQRSKNHAMCLAAIVVGVLVVLYFVVGWFYWSLVWKKAYLTQEPPPYYDRVR